MGNQLLGLLMQALLVSGLPGFTARESAKQKNSRTPVRITQERYMMFQKYVNYSSASTSSCGAAPMGSYLVDYLSIHDTDTQAAIFRNDADKEIVMAMPGTASAEDEKLDSEAHKVLYRSPGHKPMDCGRCHVHKGFWTAWYSLAKPSAAALTKALNDAPGYKLSLTGHSLGAAIASLATVGLKAQGFKIQRTVTFGEPRVGGPHYANYVDKLSGATEDKEGSYFRVTHANDPVPQLPRPQAGYRHSRTEYWESGGGYDENWYTTYRCFGQEPSNCNDGTTPSRFGNNAHMIYVGQVIGQIGLECAQK